MKFTVNSSTKNTNSLLLQIAGQSLSALLFFFITSCESPSNLGIDLQPEELQLKTIFTDTFTVKVSTVFLDSFITSNTNTGEMVIGDLSNDYTGTHTATGFSSVFLGNRETALSFGTPDSLIMLLSITDFRGDINQPITLEIYEIGDTITSQNYTPTDKLPITNLVTSFTFTPLSYLVFTGNNLTTSIPLRIPIEGAFKDKLLGAQNTDVLRLQVNFQETFKGFAYRLKGAKASVTFKLFDVGVSNTGFTNRFSRIALIQYFFRTNNSGQTVRDSILFYHYRYFYHLQSDYSTGKLANISTQKEISSTQTGNVGILQEGLPLGIKVSFPTISPFLRSQKVILNRLELDFTSALDERVPQAIRFNLTDTLGDILYNSFLASPTSNSIQSINYSSDNKAYNPILLTRLFTAIAPTNSRINIGANVVIRSEFSERTRLLVIKHSPDSQVKAKMFFTRYN